MRPEKQAIMQEVQGRLEKGTFVLLVDFRGLRVDQMTDLRGQLRRAGSSMQVVKNAFLGHAANRTGRGAMASIVSGPTAMITGTGDITQIAKVLRAYIKDNASLPVVRGGMLGTRPLSPADVVEMANIEPREVLLARVVGTIAAPMSQLVGVLNQKLLSVLYVLKAVEQKKQQQG